MDADHLATAPQAGAATGALPSLSDWHGLDQWRALLRAQLTESGRAAPAAWVMLRLCGVDDGQRAVSLLRSELAGLQRTGCIAHIGDIGPRELVFMVKAGEDARAIARWILSRSRQALQDECPSAWIAAAEAPWSGLGSAEAICQGLKRVADEGQRAGHPGWHILPVDRWRLDGGGLPDGLDAGAGRLVPQAVCSPGGALMHQRCHLEVQDLVGGGWWAARPGRWSLLDERHLMAADLMAAGLALRAIERDGLPRAVGLSGRGLAGEALRQPLAALLSRHREASAGLTLEVELSDWRLPAGQRGRLADVLARSGARLGLRYAGPEVMAHDVWGGNAVRQVRLCSSWCVGLADRPHRQVLIAGVVRWLHGQRIQVWADGAVSARDREALALADVDGWPQEDPEALPTAATVVRRSRGVAYSPVD